MNLTLITEPEYTKRLEEIMYYKQLGFDNDIKVHYSLSVLDKAGRIFKVNHPGKKSNKMKSGTCYGNAIRKMKQGFYYVEGVATNKETGFKFSHAWNINPDGNHIDFTIMDTLKYEYNGIFIPKNLLYKIGEKNGKVWYCNLPFIKLI